MVLTSYLLLGIVCFQAATSATPKDEVSRTGQKSLAFLNLTPSPYLCTCGKRRTCPRRKTQTDTHTPVLGEGGEFAKVIATLARGTKVRFCNSRAGTSGEWGGGLRGVWAGVRAGVRWSSLPLSCYLFSPSSDSCRISRVDQCLIFFPPSGEKKF